ncbi:GNAT family N-acetyltransferase [Methanotrichaceae archaeon M04Ac]|uniref:GNAT family N-acetyltransferase n=1 Tax=Candidatus Methanocrinis alkalitolerans TaxID=3033395 RepID=A0ABT5XDX8_9EURY|nr:GNAT family N-acetyltransferase [Candidatus Methanocrinis alkalitolerans]MCR3882768.1 GNAT family N-acetyltransferase [Methanothrix sp.]MDF0592920.1 GNAT family N-acetyltransferase [Candidatus Methanocrinis alkalitolerans]
MEMAEFALRKAVRGDVPAIVRLCRETIPEVYGPIIPAEALHPWVEGDAVTALVEEQWPRMTVAVAAGGAGIEGVDGVDEGDEGGVVGVAATFEDAVDLLWVHPHRHGRGIGTALLDRAEEEMREEGHRTGRLCCFTENLGAMSFYMARGWKVAADGVNEETGAPETRMVKSLLD